MKPLNKLKPNTIRSYRRDLNEARRIAADRTEPKERRHWAVERVAILEARLGLRGCE